MGVEWGRIIDFNWTLVINLLQFAVLLILLRWILWKPALKYLDRRRELIAARMAAAKTSEEKATELVGQRATELAAVEEGVGADPRRSATTCREESRGREAAL